MPIDGMTCSSCSAAVDKGIRKLDGIEDITVNAVTGKAFITYDTQAVRVSEMKQVVTKLGYTPKELEKSGENEDVKRTQDEANKMWFRFKIAIGFAIPLLYAAMGPMAGLPLPVFMAPDTAPLAFT